MEKEDLVELSKNLSEETLYARAYKDILDQFNRNREKYMNEINQSNVFYSMVEMALVEALSIRLSRLFDSKNSLGLHYLMDQAEQHIDFFPKDRGTCCFENEGVSYEVTIPLRHTLRDSEKQFFQEKVKREESFMKLFADQQGNMPEITIDVSIEELTEMYRKRFHSLKNIKRSLVTQRNKIYAHNDKDVSFSFKKIYDNNSLSYDDIEKLLQFSEDYTAFCYEYLSGNYAAHIISDIDDWTNTLELVQKGLDSLRKEWMDEFGDTSDIK